MVMFVDDKEVKKTPVFIPAAQPDRLCFRTEVCTLELLFSEYIRSLIPVAESFEPGKQLTSSDIDQVIFLVRLLREQTINQLLACIHSAPDDVDPFFGQQSMPQLVVVYEKDFNPSATMPISAYMHRLSMQFQGFNYDMTLNGVDDPLFKIGVTMKPEDDGKHFLMLPDQKKLLEAARDGVLMAASSF